jgi:hypothetical protein
MKKNFISIAVIAMFLTMTGCGGSKQSSGNVYKAKAGNPFEDVYEPPCTTQDDDEYFAATGIANGSKNRMDVLQTRSLTNAQNIVRQKMQHAYKGAIDDYSKYIGTNAGSDADVKVERAGTQIINAVINNTKAWCGPKFSGVDEKGNVTCFVGIKISAKEIADKIIDHVSKDEELRIRFQEQEFRKHMFDNFEKFKER